jgi:hypothetical protein
MIPFYYIFYVGVYMHELLILTEYSCRHEHAKRSVSIVTLKEFSGLEIRLSL